MAESPRVFLSVKRKIPNLRAVSSCSNKLPATNWSQFAAGPTGARTLTTGNDDRGGEGTGDWDARRDGDGDGGGGCAIGVDPPPGLPSGVRADDCVGDRVGAPLPSPALGSMLPHVPFAGRVTIPCRVAASDATSIVCGFFLWRRWKAQVG